MTDVFAPFTLPLRREGDAAIVDAAGRTVLVIDPDRDLEDDQATVIADHVFALSAAPAAPQAAGVGEDKVRRLEAIARGYGSGWIVQDFDHGRMTGDDILELIAALRAPSRDPEGGAVDVIVQDAVARSMAEDPQWSEMSAPARAVLMLQICRRVTAALATREEAPAEAGEPVETGNGPLYDLIHFLRPDFAEATKQHLARRTSDLVRAQPQACSGEGQ